MPALTDLQRRILAAGRPDKHIADTLGISLSGAKKHVER
jgi:DNA-binding CsgD family transcriptional regulator